MALTVGPLGAVGEARRPEQLAAGPDQDDTPVVAAEAPATDPRDLAHRAQLVQQPRLVARQRAGRTSRSRTDAGIGRPASWSTTSARRSSAAEPRSGVAALADRGDAVPRRQEPRQRDRVDRLDLAPQLRQRPPAKQPQHVRIAPLAFRAAGPELAAEQRARRHQPLQGVLDDARWAAPSDAPVSAPGTARASAPSARAARRARPTAGARNAWGTPTGGATPTPSR